ncbi:MAG: dihydroorotase [Anaerolineaceae bacterium]|nr:dihydroorotase [Anaerolineaceae bacterium]
MDFHITNANVYRNGTFKRENVSVSDRLLRFGRPVSDNDRIIPGDGLTIFPGFADVHVHFREPGFSYKETIATGTRAAAHGGYTAVCTMPNLNPTPDTFERLSLQLEAIGKDAVIPVFPYGTITRDQKGEELSDMKELAPHVIAFSDDGHGVQRDEIMQAAMINAKSLGKLITAHCEDNALLRGGYIHDGAYAAAHGHKGICSESEWGQIARDLELVEKTGCGYHVCHISAGESVDLIRKAKKKGLNVSCETAPHYLLLNDSMLQEDGRFKMNPPIRTEEDRQALLEGLRDGTIDMIATDHAPHSAEEKSRGLEKSLMGIVGLETAFPLLYTNLVLKGELSLKQLIDLLCVNPRKRFGLPGTLTEGEAADFTVFDLNAASVIDPQTFLSKGHSTPFEGWEVKGKCIMTFAQGNPAYQSEQ